MPRTRLAIAIVPDAPLRTELDGLRRALGARLERIPPHITIVPPFNVNDDDLLRLSADVRRAVSALAPFEVVAERTGTFLPGAAVVLLHITDVAGLLERLHSELHALIPEGAVRGAHRPFVPHLTLGSGLSVERIERAVASLTDYRAVLHVHRVVLLRQGEGQVWSTLLDAPLARPIVIGRGGIELQLVTSETVPPEAVELLEGSSGEGDLVVTAWSDGAVVGLAVGHCGHRVLEIARLRVTPAARGQGIGAHLLSRICAVGVARGAQVAVDLGDCPVTEQFLQRHGFVNGLRHL